MKLMAGKRTMGRQVVLTGSGTVLLVTAVLLGLRPVDGVIEGVAASDPGICGSPWFPEFPPITVDGVAPLCQGQGHFSAMMATAMFVLGGMFVLAAGVLGAITATVERAILAAQPVQPAQQDSEEGQ